MTANTPPPSAPRVLRQERIQQWHGKADALIVGFGIAGACAALEAAAHGASCLLFEVAAAAGGSTALSGGEFYLGGNDGTDVQRAHGYPDATKDFHQYMLMAGGPGADAERVRMFAEDALCHYAWLQAQGIPFKGSFHATRTVEPYTDDTLLWTGSEAAWPFNLQAKPAPRGHAAQLKGSGAGRLVMEKLAARIDQQALIEVHCNSRALALIVDEAQRVVGLQVREDNELRCYRAAKGVILCAGGFISNAEMLKLYAPEALRIGLPVSAGFDDGSGIRLGMSVGAAAIHMEQFMTTRPFIPPEDLIKGIFINNRGQRFINEDSYHGRIGQYLMRQPAGQAWLLLDSQIFARPKLYPGVEISAAAETWEEIEAELRLPPGELVHTITRYNQQAALGQDPLFHKTAEWLLPLNKPPYAALNFSDNAWPAAGFTLGGLSTRPTGEALDARGEIIPGLYAAGRTACGLPRWGEGYSSGMSLSDASYFGRRAGRHLASGL